MREGRRTNERTHTHAIPTAIFSAAATPAITSRPAAARRSRSLPLFHFLFVRLPSLALPLPLPLPSFFTPIILVLFYVYLTCIPSSSLSLHLSRFPLAFSCLCIYSSPVSSSLPVPSRPFPRSAGQKVRLGVVSRFLCFLMVDPVLWARAREKAFVCRFCCWLGCGV